MDISIITSLYRSEKFLPTYIRNIQRLFNKQQNLGFFCEVIIVANEPTAFENDLLALLSKNKHVKVISVPRESLYASWNRGLELASGKLIGFWNVDDIRFASLFKHAIDAIDKDWEVIYFPYLIMGWVRLRRVFNLKVFRFSIGKVPDYNKVLFSEGMFCGPFFMLKQSAIKKVGLFDEQYKIVGDFEWCLRANKQLNFYKCNKIAGVFKLHANNLSGASNNSAHLQEVRSILKAYNINKNI